MSPLSQRGPPVPQDPKKLPKTIHLEIRNLSLSIVEQPPSFSRFCRKVKEFCDERTQSTVDGGTSIASKSAALRGITILQNVSLVAEPGHVCLVMGGSGSGKTTLLNALANRVDKQQTAISGTIQVNSKDPQLYRKTRQIAYLQQEDYLLSYIT
ncbi:hypothetical protein BGZ67_005263 [Mortierella alpina]|nr:hypothetical protein BGZ67_005263 [Mortierella alpina]